MTRPTTTDDQLLDELRALRERLSALEAVEIDRAKAGAVLRASEVRFRALYEHLPAMYFTLGTDGTVLSVNSHGARELGYTAEDLMGESVLMVFHPEDREAVTEQLQRAVRERDRVARWEFRKQRKDGSVLWVHESVRAVEDQDGRTVVLVVCEDITLRKEAERRLIEQQKQLESLTSQLLLAEERERRRIAEGVHDHLGQILAMTKIKLGEALNAVDSNRARAVVAEARELVAKTIEASRGLTFELGAPILHELGFEAAIQSHCERVGDASGLDVKFESSGDPPGLDQETTLILFRIVRELLHNVVKHARASTAGVGVDFGDGGVQIRVVDDGVGFDVDTLESPEGTPRGFGLFSVRMNVRVLDGTLEINSKPERGTRVTALIPKQPELTQRA